MCVVRGGGQVLKTKRVVVWGSAVVVLLSGAASAAIDLEFRPAEPTFVVGDVVSVGLYAVSDSSEIQLF